MSASEALTLGVVDALADDYRDLVQAAVARNIPFRRLTDGSLVLFGWGSRQRRIQAAETDRSSAIAESIAQDKELTKRLLDAAASVFVITQDDIARAGATSIVEALRLARGAELLGELEQRAAQSERGALA
mgnify:CR=1 FL=1